MTKILESQSGRMKSRKSKGNNASGCNPSERSLNAVFCGCIAARSEYNKSDCPRSGTNTQLLPTSAVQSMKRLSITEGDTTPSTSVHSCQISQAPNRNACLPSSVLFPNSLLLPPRDSVSINEVNSSNSHRSKRWQKFKIQRKRTAVPVANCDQSLKLKDCAKSPAESKVVIEDTNDLNIDEALVFSPLPSQKAPELPVVEHHTALLGPRSEKDKGKKCFVIDLDETLVHSSFKMVEQADFKVGVEIDGVTHRVYVLKRPHVDVFLSTMANLYECVLFTASLAKYADPVADFLDKWNVFRYRLFRESCVYHRGNYVKDLSHLGRPINQVVILDNSPASYMFHASHAVQISSWFDDANDRALLDLIPYFEKLASHPNVVEFLRTNTPPTPHAAVGTVGLATGVFAALAPNSDPVGRPCESGSVISNVRRPAVVSPLPTSTAECRPCRPVPISTSDSHPHADPRKSHGNSHGSSRAHTSNALPVITRMAAPSSGPSLSPSHAPTDPTISFPAPLSLATYLPIPPLSNSSITILSTTSGSSSQARLKDSPRPISTIFSPIATTTNTTPTGVPQVKLEPSKTPTTVSRVSTPTAYTPYSSLLRHKSPPITTTPRKVAGGLPPTCTSSGENHNPVVSTMPQKLGTVKSIPGDLSPLQTVSPPPSITQSSHTNRKTAS